ncbi:MULTISPECIES: hypothetical protein [Sphingomonas]|jgi:hypothetical protein|uniref:Uncharacterized protein n=1 Tax=Sphingomonas lycopersici TaxID=2951807 RepID=A0AA41ZDU8_9SPHN|nr:MULTISPECIES: hypothetical protein [Sphingomonas]MCW6528699.1 hypothetical protein [Sphingomonas lycopersici]MCW6533908.1 hypothetical protein [Sphingomonas lycopersici]
MPTQFNQVHDVLTQLHKSGVVNLDKSVNDMLSANQALGRLTPGETVATSVIAWDGYGVVIKGNVANVAALGNVADQLRTITTTPKQ